MTTNTKYKVHIAYIDDKNRTIYPGIYTEKDIDLAIARNRSVITAETTNVEVDTIIAPVLEVKTFNNSVDIPLISLTKEEETVKVEAIKINSADQETLETIKGVGKTLATKIIRDRKATRFVDYEDLNKRVPLPAKKKWQDISVLDFEYNPFDTSQLNLT